VRLHFHSSMWRACSLWTVDAVSLWAVVGQGMFASLSGDTKIC